MANYNPDTSGLISLADRTKNERTTIQSAGGIASGKKRKEIKRMYDIIQGIRQESDEDPVESAIKALFSGLKEYDTSISDIIKGLGFIKDIEGEDRQQPQQIIYKYITQEEKKEIDEHINSFIGDTNNEP